MTRVENHNDPTSDCRTLEPDELNDCKARLIPMSRLRQSIPQIFAVGAHNLLLIAFGSTLGFPMLLLPALLKYDPDIPVTGDDLTWIFSINFFALPLGSIAGGPISQLVGRKKSMFIANIPFIVGWVLLHYASTPAMLYISLALTGLTGGLIVGPVLTYVAEVTQPHLRGLLSSTSTMSSIFGILLQLLAGCIADWRRVALMNITFPLLCATALLFIPESPYWLAGKGRVKEVEKSLCFLRGWVSPSHVREEVRVIMLSIEQPSDQRNSNVINGREKFWQPYIRKSLTKPFLLVTIASFADAFGGSLYAQTYGIYIFGSMDASIDRYTATAVLGVAEFVGTFTCVLSIHFTGKRKLTFFSLTGTGLCYLCTAIYSYLLNYDVIDSEEAWTWLPTTLFIGAAFLSHVGMKQTPWILMGEVFPTMIRAGVIGIAASINFIFRSIMQNTFFYMINSGIEISGTFIFYAAINLLASTILYFILPETEGRTLRDIEEHYSGISNLKNKPRKDELPMKEQCAASNLTFVADDGTSGP